MHEPHRALPDPFARVDGHANVAREPVWGLITTLSPLERQLLRSPPLRRLHFVAHGGVAAFASAYVHTRLQHVLGVFALTAHFVPSDPHLRAAALLHDVGHPPFSHALEAIPAVDHHRWTALRIVHGEVAEALRGAGLDPQRVLALADGQESSVLKNREGVLHLDHLDSLVRSAWMRGTLARPPADLLAQVRRDGERIAFPSDLAEQTERLVLEEAHLHGQPFDLAATAVLSDLVARLIVDGQVPLEALADLTDTELSAALLAHDATHDETRRLRASPWQLRLEPLGEGDAPPPGARLAVKDRLYLDLPHVPGRSDFEREARRAELEARTDTLRGRFAVRWQLEEEDRGYGGA